MKAIWRGQVIAESDRTLLEVDRYQYFPREAVRMDLLRLAPKTQSDLACPNGVQFYDVVEGAKNAVIYGAGGAIGGAVTPRQRLKRYLDLISGILEDAKWNRGCLIGDFSLETTSRSKLLRERLEGIFQEWRAPFASCIAEAQTSGEIDSTFDPMDLAEFLLASWEGAILRMKVERGPVALDRFKKIVFQTIFSKPY